jgi:hypothetical protein
MAPDQSLEVDRLLDECGNVIEGDTGVGAGAGAGTDWEMRPSVACKPEEAMTPEPERLPETCSWECWSMTSTCEYAFCTPYCETYEICCPDGSRRFSPISSCSPCGI